MSGQPNRQPKWAIEDSFPVVEINRLARPERNSFKPIYKMHKWFARRASCVFRAILLGCLKPLPVDKDGNPTKSGAEAIMEELYKDHTHDADTKGKVILDPFMGGGTTVVEALRLGCKVVGIDLNPVAWFIVKTETTPVDMDDLQRSFDDLAKRTVPWSGKPLKQTLLDLYKTTCPCCGNTDADIVNALWVKSAICTDPTCRKQVPLFKDYFVASKQPSIRYYQDVSCPKCHKTFDWETEPASLIAEQSLTIVNNTDGAGIGRGNKRWVFAAEEPVCCPWCGESVKPRLAADKLKAVRKKVSLTVLLCSDCQAVWQYRGSVPDSVTCPACKYGYEPHKGNIPQNGKFICPHCGKKDAVLSSIRSLPADQPLPMSMYTLQGYCPSCRKDGSDRDPKEEDAFDANLGASTAGARIASSQAAVMNEHRCLLTKSGGKFIKRIDPADLDLYASVSRMWKKNKSRLPYPISDIQEGFNTNQMIKHHYHYWRQMFTERQLLGLSTVLEAIAGEPNLDMQDMHLTTFQALIERNNVFCRYFNDRNTIQGCFSRHDFQPKMTPAESSIWGRAEWRGTVPNLFARTLGGKRFNHDAFDYAIGKGTQPVSMGERVDGSVELAAEDSTETALIRVGLANMVVTDPPYAGNVNYSELSDLFYVWLRLLLKDRYSSFAPEFTPKMQEIVENPTRGKTMEDFTRGLTEVFTRCSSALQCDGLLVFTFHHAEGAAWEAVLEAICQTGFELVAAYPVHGEKETSAQLMNNAGISYDLIHVCRKRQSGTGDRRSWAGIRQEIRRRARQEIETIEAGRYGNDPMSPADVNIILIGKCLELYSRHYGHVLDHKGENVPLHDALEAIRMEVDQLISTEQPLPSELEDIDPISYVYFRCLAERTSEIKGDELHKYTRGVIEPDELLKGGLIIKGRTGRGRYFEIKSPAERFTEIQQSLGQDTGQAQTALPGMEGAVAEAGGKMPFINYVHFLIALVEGGENLRPWMERFRGKTPQIRAACEYLRARQPRFADACGKILKFIEVTPLFG